MEVFIEKTNKTIKVEAKTIKELLKKLKINSTTVLVVKNDEIILENEKINPKDKIKILSVVSGG